MDSENKNQKYDLMPSEQRALALAGETSVWLNVAKFEQMQRVATMLSQTDYIPDSFKNKVGNCMIALDLAARMRTHPIMLMQTMYVVHGRPGFEGKFLSALVNGSGRYEGKLKYEWKGTQGTPEWGCRAWAILKGTDERVNGPWVDWRMVVAEGWHKPKGGNKPGSSPVPSKWTTMPELMFMYRAASYFCNVNDSDLKMGMQTLEELQDTGAHDMVQGPGGVYTTGDGPKPGNLYDVNKEPPKQAQEPEASTAAEGAKDELHSYDSGGPVPPGDGGSGPQEKKADPKEQPGPWAYESWRTLKGPGIKALAEQHRALFGAQTVTLRETFKDKWLRCKELSVLMFPFNTEGRWIGYDQATPKNEDPPEPEQETISLQLLEKYNQARALSAKLAKDEADLLAGLKPTINGSPKPQTTAQMVKWLYGFSDWFVRQGLEDPLADKEEVCGTDAIDQPDEDSAFEDEKM